MIKPIIHRAKIPRNGTPVSLINKRRSIFFPFNFSLSLPIHHRHHFPSNSLARSKMERRKRIYPETVRGWLLQEMATWRDRKEAGRKMNTNGNVGSQEGGNGTDYGSSEETAALLSRAPPPPVVVAAASQGKPVLTRQDRATFLVASPQLSVSGLGGSEESGTTEDPATRSVPDIELYCRLDGEAQQPQPQPPQPQPQAQQVQQTIIATVGYRSRQPSHQHRCRCDRRDSLAPSSALHLARSVSR